MAKSKFIAVRVTSEILESLDQVALVRGKSRSTLIRDLLANCHSLYHFLELERARQRTDRIMLDGDLSQWVLDNMPQDMTTEALQFVGEVMRHAAEMKAAREKQKVGGEGIVADSG